MDARTIFAAPCKWSAWALLLLLSLLLLGGCRSRELTTVQAHTLVRDSVAVRGVDTVSVVWRYKIDTVIVNDTIRHIVEEGERVEQGRRSLEGAGVKEAVKDTVYLNRDRIIPHVERVRRSDPVTQWLWGGAILALLLFAVGWVIKQVKR